MPPLLPREFSQGHSSKNKCLRGPFLPETHVSLHHPLTLFASLPEYYSPSQAHIRLQGSIAQPIALGGKFSVVDMIAIRTPST